MLDVGCCMLDLLTPISPLRPPVPSWEGSGVGNSALRIPHSAFNRPAGFSLPAPASACHEYRFAWSPRPRVRANPAPSGYPFPSPANASRIQKLMVTPGPSSVGLFRAPGIMQLAQTLDQPPFPIRLTQINPSQRRRSVQRRSPMRPRLPKNHLSMPISDHSRKDKEILVTAKQGTALDKRRQRSPETGFPVDFHWTKVTIASCKPGLSLNFVVWVHICHNITVRRRAELRGRRFLDRISRIHWMG